VTTASLSIRASSAQLLRRILDQPDLVAAVQGLDAAVLGRLVDHIGLADAGELVGLATSEQLRQIFDEDLWRSERPGQAETFDGERFALWLEVLLETGEDFVARKLAELDEDLLTLAVHRNILVLNGDRLGVELGAWGSEAERRRVEKVLESSLSYELEEFLLVARDLNAWDPLLNALVTLERDHVALLRRILERCCHLASEYIEDNGSLYDVLTADEQLESDVGFEREKRREQEGYVPPQAASGFLLQAQKSQLAELLKERGDDAITRAYFRAYAPSVRSSSVAQKKSAAPASRASSCLQSVAQLMGLLREADLIPAAGPSQPLLAGSSPQLPQGQDEARVAASALDASPLLEALRFLEERGDTKSEERRRELTYLANVLIAGCPLPGRAFRPVEAAAAVPILTNLGFVRIFETETGRRVSQAGPRALAERLDEIGIIKCFRIGWHLLRNEEMPTVGGSLVKALHRLGVALEADPARRR